MSIGLSSKSKAMFGLCLLIGVGFSAVFGIVSASPTVLPSVAYGINRASILAISAVFVIHAAERYNRHVADCSPFLELT